MEDERTWQSGYYKDLPQGDVLSDYLTEFWLISDLFDMESISLSMGTVGPGDAGPLHKHEPPIEEVYICFQGPIDHEVQDPETGEIEVINAQSGTISYFPPGVPHRPVNRYDSDAVQIAIRSQGGSAEEMEEGQTIVEDQD